jgi:hypothetical protein
VFGEAAVSFTTTEYGVLCATFFCMKGKVTAPTRLVSKVDLKHIMAKGDKIYDDEEDRNISVPGMEDLTNVLKGAIKESFTYFKYYTQLTNLGRDGLSDLDDNDNLVAEINNTIMTTKQV